MLVQVSVQSLGLDRASNTPVVILQENDGDRVLPRWIGPGEASAIAMEMADMKFSRPLTHDLLASVVGGLGGALQKVVISRVEENTYFAEMIIRRNRYFLRTPIFRPTAAYGHFGRTPEPRCVAEGRTVELFPWE